jgi:hypothetical protein
MGNMNRSAIYEILVGGSLDESWSEWFGLAVEPLSRPGEAPLTRLCGEVADQPALFGVLLKIRDLNLELVRVEKIG